MQQKQIEKIQESQKNRAYHEEKIKKALEKNETEISKKREVEFFIIIKCLIILFEIRFMKASKKLQRKKEKVLNQIA